LPPKTKVVRFSSIRNNPEKSALILAGGVAGTGGLSLAGYKAARSGLFGEAVQNKFLLQKEPY
jgi:2-phosphoglycerate kinase